MLRNYEDFVSSNMSGKVFADNTGCVGWYRYCHDHDNKGGRYGTGIVIIMMSMIMITREVMIVVVQVLL